MLITDIYITSLIILQKEIGQLMTDNNNISSIIIYFDSHYYTV